jgi:DNA-binding CsgD family transcriptional regulator
VSSALQLAKQASKRDLASTLDIIDAALQVGSEAQFRSVMRLTCELLPIQKADICVAEIGTDNAIIRNNRRININDYPTQWVTVYRQRSFNLVDPVARQLFVAQKPLIWSRLRKRADTPAHKSFYGTAAEFGLKDGFAFGARFENSSSGSFFSCVGEDLARHPRHQVLLNYLVPHLHVALSKMQLGHQKSKPKLTAREIEVLSWAKFGKTNWEISVLIGVSSRAVKFHLENAMSKLNVVNRTQATAVALSLGLIHWS